jgi:hypothetical protein
VLDFGTAHLLECGATEPNAVKKGESYEKGRSATTGKKWSERAARVLHRRRKYGADRRQNQQEVFPNASLGVFERRFSRLRNPRERVTFARRKRGHSDRSFSGRTRRSRWLHFLFLPFPAGNISQGPGSFHFDAAIESVSVSVSASASGEKSVGMGQYCPLVLVFSTS